MSRGRGWRRAVAGLAVASVFVVLLAQRVDWVEMRQVLAGARWPMLVLGLLALATDMAVRITRWWWMLRSVEPDLPLRSCVRPFLGSLALNNVMPLRAGDVVRVLGFRRTLRAPTAHLLGTLLLERMLDLLVLLAVLFVGVLGTSGVFPRPFLLVAGLAGVGTVALLLALTLGPGHLTALVQRLLARLFSRRAWLPTLSRAVAQLSQSLSILRSPRRALALLGLSLLAWSLEGAVFACVTWSLQIQIPWPATWLSLGSGTLATLLPSSPGYVGTFDYFAALGLTAYGASAAAATAFAVLTHLILWLPVTAAGLIALALRPPGEGLAGRPRAAPVEAEAGA
jgi:uncharacterized protein (TIRG00374 family)